MVEVRSSPRKTAPAQRVLSQRGSFSSKIYRSPCTEAAWGAGGGGRGEREITLAYWSAVVCRAEQFFSWTSSPGQRLSPSSLALRRLLLPGWSGMVWSSVLAPGLQNSGC